MLGYGQSNWGISFRPWYRIPEDAKEDDGDLDSAPALATIIRHHRNLWDILRSVGAYKHGKLEYNALIRGTSIQVMAPMNSVCRFHCGTVAGLCGIF